jgi:hypothetical protein
MRSLWRLPALQSGSPENVLSSAGNRGPESVQFNVDIAIALPICYRQNQSGFEYIAGRKTA